MFLVIELTTERLADEPAACSARRQLRFGLLANFLLGHREPLRSVCPAGLSVDGVQGDHSEQIG